MATRPPLFFVFPLLAMLAMLVLGVAMLVRGWRGRKVGSDPHCKRCGFNLIGLPPDSTRCSECGADVGERGAIVHGHRTRRVGMMIAGACVALIPLLIFGTLAVSMARSTDLNELKPLWWLKRDADSTNVSTRLAAFREMQNRVGNGSLHGSALRSLVASILTRQADLNEKWDTGWGDLFEAARKRPDTVSDAQWATYAQNAVKNAISLRARPRVRRGDPVPYEFRIGGAGWRGGGGSFGGLWIELAHDVQLGDFSRGRDRGGSFGFSGSASGTTGSTIEANDVARAHLTDGPNTLRAVMHARVSYDQGGPAVTQIDIPLQATFTLLPADQPSVVAAPDPSQAQAIHDAMRPQGVQVRKGNEQWTSLEIQFDVRNVPAAVAFDVFLRERGPGARETKLSSIALPAGATTHYGLGSNVKPDVADAMLNVGAVDVVLRPSGPVAARTVTLTEHWSGDEPIVIENVPVKRD